MKYDLIRFKIAQDNCYPHVLSEIKNGKKTSHWMWYIFPQISGLGKSVTAKKYGIENIKRGRTFFNGLVTFKKTN